MGVEARLSTWNTHTQRLSPLREDDPLATFSLTDNYLRAPSGAPGGAAGHCCCGALPVGRGGSLLSRIGSIWTVNAQSADPSCIKGLPRWKRVERPPGDCSVKVSPRIRLNVIKHLGASPKTTPPLPATPLTHDGTARLPRTPDTTPFSIVSFIIFAVNVMKNCNDTPRHDPFTNWK